MSSPYQYASQPQPQPQPQPQCSNMTYQPVDPRTQQYMDDRKKMEKRNDTCCDCCAKEIKECFCYLKNLRREDEGNVGNASLGLLWSAGDGVCMERMCSDEDITSVIDLFEGSISRSSRPPALQYDESIVMAIAEIALLRLLPPYTANDASLLSKLGHAKQVMEKFTSRQFYYMQQVENPSLLYIIGEWDSVDQHIDEFIPSADNQAILESLKDVLVVDWLFHIDAPHADLPLPKSTDDMKPTFGITRLFVRSGEKGNFQKMFEENRKYLQDFITEGTIGGGWRADPEDGKDEFVVFSPWKDVEQHHAFAKTDGFEKYGRIRDFLEGAEIKHANIIEM
ncbi:hypothetical protein CC78DRAFT_546236 [Lojkania enalia]|uniref:ABM domain-containing protein n=1 Tax=Lojkania enalia TaxID=147567 RepID=A0A9P4K8D2_9PLEO|nr:hypothetical protein CC78DRAFT_546236 [Didymosphaeria enalia]